MTKENREILLRTTGVVDGLYWAAPTELKDALEHVSDSLEYILKTESEEQNERT